MSDPVTISKESSPLPEYLDFSRLRETGINHLIELGKDLWTDFNLHDPGITILEVLCYALTDLGYRTNFEISDILARSPEQYEQDTQLGEQRKDKKRFDDNFFTPEQILTCNPVTLTDLRKLLLDISGVKNAYLKRAESAEVPIYINSVQKQLQLDSPAGIEDGTQCQVRLRGLYHVFIELDDIAQTNECGVSELDVGVILDKVYETLHAHRNLCEDFLSVKILGDEKILLCSNIELKPDADATEVLFKIYRAVQEFLSPTFRFYTLKELLDDGKNIEEIFAGRPLSLESHGFIDVDQLNKSEPRSVIYVSDIYREILNIDGVLAVRNLQLTNYINDLPLTKGETWCLPLTEGHRATLDFNHNCIQFYKGPLPQSADKAEAFKKYKEERLARTKAKLRSDFLDTAVPEGTYVDLEDYVSIQYEFPRIYGIGDTGLRPEETIERKRKAKQLQAFLLFFDQILSNYLAQLAHARELFSFRPDECDHRQRGNNRTYFIQLLDEVPGAHELIKNVYNCAGNNTDPLPPDDYEPYLEWIAEDVLKYQERRNLFLDHLLARFAESFTEYVLVMFDVDGNRKDPAELINDKARFLTNYPEISRDRGKGFQYKHFPPAADSGSPEEEEDAQSDMNPDPDCIGTWPGIQHALWDTDNVSGFKKRVSRLLGIDDFRRRTLSRCDVEKVEDVWYYSFVYKATINDTDPSLVQSCSWRDGEADDFDDDADLPSYLRSSRRFADPEKAEADKIYCLELARNSSNVHRITYQASTLQNDDDEIIIIPERHAFQIVDPDTSNIVATSSRFVTREERDQAMFEFLRCAGYCDTRCDIVEIDECYHYVVWRVSQATDEHFEEKTPILVSSRGFKNEADARTAFEEIQKHHAELEYVPMGSEQEGYGFKIQNSDGDILASNVCEDPFPASLCLEEACDRAEPCKLECTTRGVPGKVGFEVRSIHDDVSLFKQVHLYKSEEEAQSAYETVLGLADHRVYYITIDDCSPDAPFGFALLDYENDRIASHPHCYETDCARDLALDGAVYAFRDAKDIRYSIEAVSEGYHIKLEDDRGKALLVGTIIYATEEEAILALDDFLDAAKRPGNYMNRISPINPKPYSFFLKDDEGTILAEHLGSYAEKEERYIAIRAIVLYVSPAKIAVSYSGPGGRYFFDLSRDDGQVILQNPEALATEYLANIACSEVLMRMVDVAGFERFGGESGAYGFNVVDDQGTVLAIHPDSDQAGHVKTYSTEAARDAIIAYLHACVQEPPEKIYKVSCNAVGHSEGVAFEVRDEAGRILFVSAFQYATETEAASNYAHLKEIAAHRVYYATTDTCSEALPFGVNLYDYDRRLFALHPECYPTDCARDLALDELTYIFRKESDVLVDTEWVEEADGYRIVLLADDEKRLLVGLEIHDSEDLARSTFDDLLSAASMLDRYRDLSELSPDKPYGFELLNENDEALAHHPDTYVLPEERDQAKSGMVRYVSEETIRVDYHERGGHFYNEIRTSEGLVLLRGLRIYDDEETACLACDQFMQLAGLEENYVLEKEEDRFGFRLRDENGQDTGIHPDPDQHDQPQTYPTAEERDTALHLIIASILGTLPPPVTKKTLGLCYDSEIERDLRKMATTLLFDSCELRCETVGTVGTYGFNISDAEGTILLEHVKNYTSESDAREDGEYATRLAEHRVYYATQDDCSEEAPYGFRLLDEYEQPLAGHPTCYTTDCARDLALDGLVYLFRNEEHVQYDIESVEEEFRFVLEGDEQIRLLEGAERYATEEEARSAYYLALKRARFEGAYIDRTVEGDKPLSFDVVDEDGTILAHHADSYEDEEEKRLAKKAILQYITLAGASMDVTTIVAGHFQNEISLPFNEQGDEGTWVVLCGEAVYPDRETAQKDCELLLKLARKKASYNPLPTDSKEGFNLHNEEGKIVAHYPIVPEDDLFTDGVRDALIDLILTCGGAYKLTPQFVNTGGAFVYTLMDQLGAPLLRGTQVHASREQAELCFSKTFGLGSDAPVRSLGLSAENYRKTDSGIGASVYSFELTNHCEQVVAVHPYKYATSKERDAAFEKMLFEVRDLSHIEPVIEVDPETASDMSARYRYFLMDADDSTKVMRSSLTWSKEDARRHFDEVFLPHALDQDNYEIIYNNRGCIEEAGGSPQRPYSFTLHIPSEENPRMRGAKIAESLQHFFSRSEAEIHIQRIIHHVKKQDIQFTCEGNECGIGFAFSISLEDQSYAFNNIRMYPGRPEAMSVCHGIYEHIRAGSDDGCAVSNVFVFGASDKTYHLFIRNPQNEWIAVSEKSYATASDAYRDRTSLIDAINAMEGCEFSGNLLESNPAYRFKLVDGQEPLFTGELREIIDGEDDATKNKVWQECNRFHEFAQAPSFYRKIFDEQRCEYSFELLGLDIQGETERILATHPGFYTSLSEVDRQVDKISKFVNDEGFHLVEHLLLRPRTRGSKQLYGYAVAGTTGVGLNEVYFSSQGILYNDTGQRILVEDEVYTKTGEIETGYVADLINRLRNNYSGNEGEKIAVWSYNRDQSGVETEVPTFDLAYCEELQENIETAGDQKAFSFRLKKVNNSNGDSKEGPVLAEHGTFYDNPTDRDLAICRMFDALINKNIEYSVDVIDYNKGETGSDKLLPITQNCTDSSGNLCSILSDPYSFWATVVIPYWPERFRDVDFRSFIERTMRLEAPAHVFLRICWVDACSMRDFERAFRRWLTTQQQSFHCDATLALKELLDIVSSFTSVYTADVRVGGKIKDDEDNSTDVKNPIVLNRTTLGTATTADQ